MSLLLDLPLEVRLAGLFLCGLAIGGQLNFGIYWLAFDRRPLSPWTPSKAVAEYFAHETLALAPRQWADCIPVFGWWRLRRESDVFGAGFWLRPMLLELAFGGALAALYGWEIRGGLFPAGSVAAASVLHAQFLAHAVLLCLLVVATFIDFDEFTIPDAITVPGVWAGLLLAVALPSSHLPVGGNSALLLVTPRDWPTEIDGPRGLMFGLAAVVAWCLAIMPTLVVYRPRRGVGYSVRLFLASLFRRSLSQYYWLMMLVCGGGVAAVWGFAGSTAWRSLLTSLAGMMFAGGIVWTVRIVGRISLGKEAMGFGDVTLMAMIGAFLGWQPSLLVFFIAPFFGILFSVVQAVLRGENMLPFGPYLSLAAALLVVKWAAVWQWAEPIFELGWLIPSLLFFCLLLMAGPLFVWRLVKEHVFGWRDE